MVQVQMGNHQGIQILHATVFQVVGGSDPLGARGGRYVLLTGIYQHPKGTYPAGLLYIDRVPIAHVYKVQLQHGGYRRWVYLVHSGFSSTCRGGT